MTKQIHHFDSLDKFYLGSENVQCVEGSDSIPAWATDISPPQIESWDEGFIPVFDPESQQWNLKPNTFWRPTVTELCFYSGRDSDGPTYLVAPRNSTNYYNVLLHYVHTLPRCFIPRLGTIPNAPHLMQRMDFINECIERLEANWLHTKVNSSSPMVGYGANYYHFQAEALVAAIRRLLDDLITAFFYKQFVEYEPWKRGLPIDSYSALLHNPMSKLNKFFRMEERSEKTEIMSRQFINDVLGTNIAFLATIQGLNNTLKHSLAANLARNSYGETHPTILSFGPASHNERNLENLHSHNHVLRQLILGLNDYLSDLTRRISADKTLPAESCLLHVLNQYPA